MPQPSGYASLVGGATAATVVDAFIYPLDTIKTRAQAKGGLIKNGGYKGLYRGIVSVVSCTVPSAALFFFAYEHCKANIPLTGVSNHLISSSIAETLSCAVLAPAEIVKQRAQVSKTQSTGQILRSLIAGRNVGLLLQGYLGLLARNVPVTAIQFSLYEAAKREYGAYKVLHGKDGKLGALESGLCAGASGSVAAAITTPMDVVKTRVMVGNDTEQRKGMWKIGSDILKKEGVSSLFRGMWLRILWTSVGMSLYLGSYEAMRNAIDDRNSD